MIVQELYTKLLETDNKSRHLILAKVFERVFSRKVRRTEWGFLRRLIKLYGSETVFWALVGSVGINSEGTPLKYVAAVCKNVTKEEVKNNPQYMSQELSDLLDYMENYQQPDWDEIQNASN